MKKTEFWYRKLKFWIRGMYVVMVILLVLLLLAAANKIAISESLEAVFAVAAGLAIVGSYAAGKLYILGPMKNLSQAFELFNHGYIYDEVFHNNFSMDEEMKKALEKFAVMIDRNHAVNMAEKQVEYLALQNQINPHFLYNTLESIRAEALLAGQASIAGMSEALAKFFRYTITNKENIVTLADELDSVKNYFLIQKYRFEERINLEIHCEDEELLFQCRILKLTLQPLVENAIQHGLEATIGEGTIEIDIERTSTRVFISVRDYGVGMDEEKIIELNRMFQEPDKQITAAFSKKKSGIALRNVNARIKLLFGTQYGLHVLGSTYSGTEIRITLPYLDEEAAKKYMKKIETNQEEGVR